MVANVHTMPINLSFIDFLHIPEQMCVRDLRERIAAGGDPTKLHESPVDNNGQTFEQGIWAVLIFIVNMTHFDWCLFACGMWAVILLF